MTTPAPVFASFLDRVHLSAIDTEAPYQRGVVKNHKGLKGDFCQKAMGYLSLARRHYPADKPYGLFDGKQRLAAYLRWAQTQEGASAIAPDEELSDELAMYLVCEVVDVFSYEEEAQLFVARNARMQLTTYRVFRARCEYNEPNAVAICDICNRCGFRLAEKNRSLSVLTGIGAVDRIFAADGTGELLEKTLLVISRTWPDDPDRTESQFLTGVSFFLARYQSAENFSLDRFVKTLRKSSTRWILNRAAAAADGGTHRQEFIVEILLRSYNRGLPEDRRIV